MFCEEISLQNVSDLKKSCGFDVNSLQLITDYSINDFAIIIKDNVAYKTSLTTLQEVLNGVIPDNVYVDTNGNYYVDTNNNYMILQ